MQNHIMSSIRFTALLFRLLIVGTTQVWPEMGRWKMRNAP